MMQYINRALATVYFVAFAMLATSLIGQPNECTPLTWRGAWGFLGLLAVGMFLAALDGSESRGAK